MTYISLTATDPVIRRESAERIAAWTIGVFEYEKSVQAAAEFLRQYLDATVAGMKASDVPGEEIEKEMEAWEAEFQVIMARLVDETYFCKTH